MERPDRLDFETLAWVVDLGQKHQKNLQAVLQNLCDGLVMKGHPIDQVHVSFIPQHPQLRVGLLKWKAGQSVSWGHISWPENAVRSPVHRRNPLHRLRDGRVKEIRTRLTDSNQLDRFRLTRELARDGMTDYFALGLDGGLDVPNTLAFATREPGGFSDAGLDILRSVAWALQTIIQRDTWQRLSETVCLTYIGTRAGARVLSGDIRRGQSTRIQAVVWFCDMRGYTELTGRLDDEGVFKALHAFFDAVGTSVESNGGEILKFIGDSVLAIFPYDTETEAPMACRSAYSAAVGCLDSLDHLNHQRLAANLPNLRSKIGLHRGEVVYGNVGTRTRLDFTVMGQTVNLASRVESLCSQLDAPLLMSAEVAKHLGDDVTPMGQFSVKGFDLPLEVFGLPSDKVFEASQAPAAVPPPPGFDRLNGQRENEP